MGEEGKGKPVGIADAKPFPELGTLQATLAIPVTIEAVKDPKGRRYTLTVETLPGLPACVGDLFFPTGTSRDLDDETIRKLAVEALQRDVLEAAGLAIKARLLEMMVSAVPDVPAMCAEREKLRESLRVAAMHSPLAATGAWWTHTLAPQLENRILPGAAVVGRKLVLCERGAKGELVPWPPLPTPLKLPVPVPVPGKK